jgi:Reverse transcriptase (RNA-dependent DNA polymerase)/Endonuclease-reverse transcriptase
MSLNISFVNCHGFNRKKPLIENLCSSQHLHVLGVAETWADDRHRLNLAGFTTYRRDRVCTAGRPPRGGVALFLHPQLPATRITPPLQFQDLETILCSVQSPRGPVLLALVYFPPSVSLSAHTHFFEYVSSFPNFILMGDFNARHLLFGDTASNPNGAALADFLVDLPFYRCFNSSPTYIGPAGSSIPDHILVSDRLSCHVGDVVIGPSVGSDHLPLVVATDLLPPPPPRPQFKVVKDFNNADWELYGAEVVRLLPDTMDSSSCDALQANFESLVEVLRRAAALAVPVKTIDTSRPSLPAPILALIRTKRRVYNCFRATGDPVLKTEWNRLNALVRRSIIQHRELQWTAVCSSLDHRNGAAFWHKFRCLTGQATRAEAPLVVDGEVYASAGDKAREFAISLGGVHQPPTDARFDAGFRREVEGALSQYEPSLSSNDVLSSEEETHPDLVQPITEKEVRAALARGRNTSPGEDGVTRVMLRRAPAQFLTHLTALFDGCLRLGFIPRCLKTAVVVMLPKKGQSPESLSSHRPISLLNVIAKVLEKVIQVRLSSFAELQEVLPEAQAGFRAGRSTTDPLLRLVTGVTGALNDGHCALAAFLDISRAFDKVWHDGLVYKLLNLDVPLGMVRLLRSFLKDRTIRVRVHDRLSHPVTPLAGVPQGSCLSPLLYLLYCHDIPAPLTRHISIALYADDTAYWCVGRTAREVYLRLQRQISALESWMRRWRILPNANKTQLILFHHRHKSQKMSQRSLLHYISLWGSRVYPTRSATYLGVTFSDILSWGAHSRSIILRARARFNLLVMLRGRLAGCSFATLRHTYKAFIRPLFEYAAPALVPILGSSLPRYLSLERRILRRVAGLHPRTRNEDVYEHTGVEHLGERLRNLSAAYVRRVFDAERPDLCALLSAPRVFRRRPAFKYGFPPFLLRDPATVPP